jgi:hypothetical protein
MSSGKEQASAPLAQAASASQQPSTQPAGAVFEQTEDIQRKFLHEAVLNMNHKSTS